MPTRRIQTTHQRKTRSRERDPSSRQRSPSRHLWGRTYWRTADGLIRPRQRKRVGAGSWCGCRWLICNSQRLLHPGNKPSTNLETSSRSHPWAAYRLAAWRDPFIQFPPTWKFSIVVFKDKKTRFRVLQQQLCQQLWWRTLLWTLNHINLALFLFVEIQNLYKLNLHGS